MGRAAGRIRKIWEVRQIEEMAVWDEKGSVGMGGRLRKKIGGGWVSTWQSSINDILPSQDAGTSRMVTISRSLGRSQN